MSKDWTKEDWQRHQEKVIREEYLEELKEKKAKKNN